MRRHRLPAALICQPNELFLPLTSVLEKEAPPKNSPPGYSCQTVGEVACPNVMALANKQIKNGTMRLAVFIVCLLSASRQGWHSRRLLKSLVIHNTTTRMASSGSALIIIPNPFGSKSYRNDSLSLSLSFFLSLSLLASPMNCTSLPVCVF